MAGRKQNNKKSRAPPARTRRSSRLPTMRPPPPVRAGREPQTTNHYVFAEPGDVRLAISQASASQLRQLVIRYYDNGGGSLTYDGQRLNFAAIITPNSQLAKVLARLAPSSN
ncbi:N protein [Kafue kinda chacma baboon virus]|uniref:N protein n=1 Tax=Kafue kinda chacma baboon virus TaxID=1823757 RepID=A0A0Y0BL84_9NIDO|nr:N protein [Kafue kinda chacma baboon virus]AMB20721.1 N protein [Kafue kinda chacma baboon virus]AMV49344.1 N protein [Kafue kinda chacma baboon virus]